MQLNAFRFTRVWEIQVKTLYVEPSMLLKVEDFSVFFVDFFVSVRPYACLVKPEQGMHACSEKMSVMFFPQVTQKSCYGILHGFFEEFRRFERGVSLYFHN